MYSTTPKRGFLLVFTLFAMYGAASSAQAQKNRVAAISSAKRVTLPGHLHPAAIQANDQGIAEDTLQMGNMSLTLQPSAEQQAALDDLLAQQQNPASPNYHHWLTPEEYADRFGVSQADVVRISGWLKAQNLSVISVARGRNSIAFSGAVRQVEGAFGTQIHRYLVEGESHYSNSDEPSIPAALSGVVSGIRGLNDFRPKPRNLRLAPAYTSASTGNHYLAPDDVATIYDVKPLYAAGINGAGQKIAIVGQTRINVTDIQQFRASYNLPASDPQVTLVPGFPDPGTSKDDLGEADLDIEWSGAIARNATILYVYSLDVTDAAHYVIDQNMAPVMSMSYGLCEAVTGSAELTSLRTYAQQGNAQGITWMAASGDNGAADCFGSTSRSSATLAAVDAPASLPEVTGVGGTEFNEGTGSFWNAANDANQATALGYIPEKVWNDSVADGTPSASGGGASAFFSKPAWQVAPGVPADGARDVPDISLAASADHDAYLFYTAGARAAVGGTSVSSPVFAGMVALLNQYQIANGFQSAAGQGNINPNLYAMAQTSPGIFHDITVGDNVVTPCAKNKTCSAAPVGSAAAVSYDTATGLGSVDAFNLVSGWHLKGVSGKAVSTLSAVSSLISVALTGSTALTATVTGASGVPTGTVAWSLAGVTLGTATLGSNGVASFTVQGSQLTVGADSITVVYSGDSVYNPTTGTLNLTVTATSAITISGMANAASFKPIYAPGMILAIFGSNLSGSIAGASSVPLPTVLNGVVVTVNDIPAPLYYVSPGQVNVQIPYSVIGPATVQISSGGQSASAPITVQAAAPGIFVDPATGSPVPNATAKRGDTLTLYVTGDGVATPLPSAGNVPSTSDAIPRPSQAVGITVGGAVVNDIPFVGIPAWSVGVTQINYTVPTNTALGPQNVIVTVGGVQSAGATITITQ